MKNIISSAAVSNKRGLLMPFILVSVLIIALAVFWFSESKKDKTEKIELIESSNKLHDISVVFINAGRADSVLVLVDGKNYLIDTGLSKSVPAIKNVLMKYNVDKLDAVFITHGHKDHLGGLKKISKSYDIGRLYTAGISMYGENGKTPVEKSADKLNLKLDKLSAGDRVKIADELYFEVIGPLVCNNDDENDNSLVLRLYVNGKVFLFAGDMQFAEEGVLLKNKIDVSADILKVGNHGNPDATSDEFAKAVSPEIAVITTDTSEDGNSANERVKRLFDKVYLTQDYKYGVKVTVKENGEIVVEDA